MGSTITNVRTAMTIDNNRRNLVKALGPAGLVALSGCIGDDDDGTTTDDDDDGVTDTEELTFFSMFFARRLQWKEDMAEAFEEETGIAVNTPTISIGEYKEQLYTFLGTSEAPDVYADWAGPGMAGETVLRGFAADISNELSQETADNYDLNLFRFGNQNPLNMGEGDEIYGVPLYAGYLPLFYNMSVLEDAGVDHTQLKRRRDVTWEEFNDVLAQVRDNTDKIPLALGNVGGGHFEYTNTVAMSKTVGIERWHDAGLGRNGVKLTDDDFVEGLELIIEWWDEGFINEDTASLSGDEAQALFYQNEAAFMTDGPWTLGRWDEFAVPEMGPVGEDWDYMWWPYRPDVYENGSEELMALPGAGVLVSQHAIERGSLSAAVNLIEFMTSSEWAAELAKGQDIPEHLDPDVGAEDLPEAWVDMGRDAAETEVVWKTNHLWPARATEAHQTASTEIPQGITAEEILERTQDALDTDLEEIRDQT